MGTATDVVLEVNDVSGACGSRTVVDGVSLEVGHGETFGLLGAGGIFGAVVHTIGYIAIGPLIGIRWFHWESL